MITIKIKAKKWFENNCEVRWDAGRRPYMIPSCFPEELKSRETIIIFLLGGFMQTLVGQTLEVTLEDRSATDMCSACYKAAGYWIPNWAIEWVKEEAD